MSLLDKIFGNSQKNVVGELPQFIPTPPVEHPQFSDSQIQFIERNHQVESKEDMINYVNQSNLSLNCKNNFINIITNLYDRNIIYADNSKMNGAEIAYLEILLDIYPIILSSTTKNDRIKPEFLETFNMIKTQLRNRLSRTVGLDRERILITKNQNSSEITMRKDGEVKK